MTSKSERLAVLSDAGNMLYTACPTLTMGSNWSICRYPSRADELLTSNLKKALELVDVKVLDHIVVGGMQTVSFAEKGLL